MSTLAALLVLLAQETPARKEFAAAVDAAIRTSARWEQAWPALADDAEFAGRLWRDLIGRAPTEEEARAFAADPDPAKRGKAIDRLVAAPEFGPTWGRRLAEALLGDLAAVRMERIDGVLPPVAGVVVNRFVAWLGEQIAKDRPFPEVVREMIETRGKGDEKPALGYKLAHFRGTGAPEELALGVARGLLGIRLDCARCHDAPFEMWNQEHTASFAAFFAREQAARVGFTDQIELRAAATGEVPGPGGKPAKPNYLFGGVPAEEEDRLKALASFLTRPKDSPLSKVLVNRIWAWLFGRGLVHPPDDFNRTFLPASPAALDALTRGFTENGHALKRFLQELCRTKVYQLSDPGSPSPSDSVYVRGYRKPWRPALIPKTFPKFAVPKEWSVYAGPPRTTRAVYRIPDRDGKARDAFLCFLAGDEFLHQMAPCRPTTTMIQGKQAVTLLDLRGPYSCDRVGGVPNPDHHVLLARFGKGPRSVLCLEGPADTVADWRETFLEILKSIEP